MVVDGKVMGEIPSSHIGTRSEPCLSMSKSLSGAEEENGPVRARLGAMTKVMNCVCACATRNHDTGNELFLCVPDSEP